VTSFLELRDVHLSYDRAEALKGISLRVDEGSVVTLLGANGAGKSTTVRAISGIIHPNSGEIWFGGERIDGMPPAQTVTRGISLVPEGRRLFPYMSVYDNLMMGSYLRRDRGETRRNLERVYASFPRLRERLRQKAGSLSGGEQQMVAIGRGLMASPKLMLLDEPTLGLSPILVQETARIIREIRESSGVTILLIEQNARMALTLADYAYVLETGAIATEGNADALLADEGIRKAYLGGG
jgi:branched-chain amino acid transport system ATP-binding protein